MPGNARLNQIDHIVVLMQENRSFDHMLGFLYPDKKTPSGKPFEGLTGEESNPGDSGPVTVFKIDTSTPDAYFMPGADPREGYKPTNTQLFRTETPDTPTSVPTMDGFVDSFADALQFDPQHGREVYPGTKPANIMGCFTPEALPVLSGLARGFAVCDQWYSSVPTMTLPNRGFALAGTSLGHMDDKEAHFPIAFDTPSIFGALGDRVGWAIYSGGRLLTRRDFRDTQQASDSHFGDLAAFKAAAANGTLPQGFIFLEPNWDGTNGNDQHPVHDVAYGEQLMLDVYNALRDGPDWNKTLLIITYDEHGGCYDHAPPPSGAAPPDGSQGQFGFGFTRFGVRVPTVLVSPLIEEETVFRVDGGTPLDHTSLLKTIEERWDVAPLTKRDKAAPGIGDVLTLDRPREDNPLAGVVVPTSSGNNPEAGRMSYLDKVCDALAARAMNE
ncbi:alkaline phosphatase family protein [Streptomyces hesseae]|uniref:Alkaline phosphatase family protein n=1 Tax=Streptomyces hesseae TaxID=3075519 RepID=A0ABU2SHV5_9ACTN|nr:alkaline phosphatase family protein [Streptomyces sp. DSM 40473]MDT0448557.1 alkaline phosphatase family protein [Streptomyces sp. DSM 40473]